MTDTAPRPTDPTELPEVVWSRVVALTAAALPSVSPLPPALRKVAAFTPARRARSGRAQIGLALADEDFRQRVAAQVTSALAGPVPPQDGGSSPSTGPQDSPSVVPDGPAGADDLNARDPVEAAALIWLTRSEGWEAALAAAVRALAERVDSQSAARESTQLVGLRRRVGALEEEARDLRARHRTALQRLKEENTELRRKLGQARAAERVATTAALDTARERDRALAQLEAATAAADAEVRRLRGQLEELQNASAASRRRQRGDRDEGTLRARLLLDALLEAGQGLRRELALPAVDGSPADRLESRLAESSTRTPSAAGALGPASPALLEQYLALPRARLIVDGYNVSKSAWPDSSLEVQRTRLLAGLAALVARSGAETTVVFDAASSTTRPPVHPPRGVKVQFSPYGVIADDVIRELVAVEPPGRVVVVVSSDLELGRDVARAGARTVTADALVAVLSR